MNNPNRTLPDRPEKQALARAPSGHRLPIVEGSLRPSADPHEHPFSAGVVIDSVKICAHLLFFTLPYFLVHNGFSLLEITAEK